MVSGGDPSEEASSRVLYVLWFIKDFCGRAIEEPITVVESQCDKYLCSE